MSIVLSAPPSLLPAPAWELRAPTDPLVHLVHPRLGPQGHRADGGSKDSWPPHGFPRLQQDFCPQKSKLGIHDGKLGSTPPPGLWESGIFGSALTGLLCSTMRESQVAVHSFSVEHRKLSPHLLSLYLKSLFSSSNLCPKGCADPREVGGVFGALCPLSAICRRVSPVLFPH